MEVSQTFFETICRVCLTSASNQNMVSLLDNSSEGLSCYGKAVLIFTNITIKNDSLPHYMCQRCLFLLKQGILFKKMCEKSHEKLKNLTKALPRSDTNAKQAVMEYLIYKRYFPEANSNETSNIGNVKETPENPKKSRNIPVKQDTKTASKPKAGPSTPKLPVVKTEVDTDRPCKLENVEIFCHENVKLEVEIEPIDNVDPEKQEDVFRDLPDQASESESDDSMSVNDAMDDNVENLLNNIELMIHADKHNIPSINRGPKNISVQTVKRMRFKARPKKRVYKKEEPRHIKCKMCDKVLANIATYNYHMQSHTGFKYVCELCAKGFPILAMLQGHQATIHGIGRFFYCNQCDFKCGRKFELTEHLRFHTGERPFACDECGLTFRRRFIWKQHLLFHKEKTVQCPKCPCKFFLRGGMLAHYNNVHERVRVYKCHECDGTYANPATVRKHLLARHGIPKEQQGKIIKIHLAKPIVSE